MTAFLFLYTSHRVMRVDVVDQQNIVAEPKKMD